jgi:PelA/Pel-15E family pectate lyase
MHKIKSLLLIIISFSFISVNAQEIKEKTDKPAIDTSPFESSAKHWYFIYDKNNIINPKPNQPKFQATEIASIADNILIYQRSNGGWPKNYDMQAILTLQQKDSLIKTKNLLNTTFDNSTTFTHIEYLSKAYTLTRNEKYKKACLQGIDFILKAQYPNGGWPQYYPLEKGYSRHITFNDNAYIGIMNLFKDITDHESYYSYIDSAYRIKITNALNKGIQCILNCQISENGILTAWCQQHDEKNLKPAWARKFEPPSICNQESVNIVLFLMELSKPDKKVICAIESAMKWFNDSKILNTRVEVIKAPLEQFQFNKSNTDRVVVIDSSAPPIWTRYYELKTHRPLFCDRNSKFLYSLAEVSRERRSGYGWYTYEPQQALNKFPQWQKKWGQKTGTPEKQ